MSKWMDIEVTVFENYMRSIVEMQTKMLMHKWTIVKPEKKKDAAL